MVTSVYVLLVPVNEIVASTVPSSVYEKSNDVINPWNENSLSFLRCRLNLSKFETDGYNFFKFLSTSSGGN